MKETNMNKDILIVKRIAQNFKRAGFNGDIRPESALIQEVRTRFDTMYDVLERILKLALHVYMVLKKNE